MSRFTEDNGSTKGDSIIRLLSRTKKGEIENGERSPLLYTIDKVRWVT
ncbi:hypothetical protein [Roseiconus lacunae]|uniref:Uncharacterized protein n=1 Tax=Roseiconus lacunae TaxID=2605694 RepID=A0ABT7PQ85_9BACT|nr:hypothetical protein [Roseiconus lacunae]MDM4018667.1 hypothetical protein [Roseiconus lacunae]